MSPDARRIDRAVSAIASLAALALALFRLDEKGLWLDEVSSAAFALGGPADWFADHNMGLYYGLLAGVIGQLGLGAWALRMPSALLYAGSAGLFAELTRRTFGRSVAVTATLMFVLDASLLRYAQEARGYMLAVFLTLLASLVLADLLARPSITKALCFGLTLAAGVHAHMFVGLVALAHALTLLVALGRRELSPRVAALALAALAAPCAPLALAVLARGGGQIAWLYRPNLENGWAAFGLWFGGGTILPALALAIFSAGAAGARRSPLATRHVFVLLWALGPITLSYAGSFFVSPFVHPKYLLVTVPALLVLLTLALQRISPPPLRHALLAAWCVASIMRIQHWFRDFEKERWREVVAHIAARAEPGDRVALDMPHPEAFDYYALRSARALPELVYPHRPYRFPSNDDDVYTLDPGAPVAPRIWLVENRSAHVFRARVATTHGAQDSGRFEPHDEDARSLFADSRGRVIRVTLLTRH